MTLVSDERNGNEPWRVGVLGSLHLWSYQKIPEGVEPGLPLMGEPKVCRIKIK